MKCGGESMSWRQSRTPFVGSRSVRMAPAAFNETSKTRTTLGHLGWHVVARAVPQSTRHIKQPTHPMRVVFDDTQSSSPLTLPLCSRSVGRPVTMG